MKEQQHPTMTIDGPDGKTQAYCLRCGEVAASFFVGLVAQAASEHSLTGEPVSVPA